MEWANFWPGLICPDSIFNAHFELHVTCRKMQGQCCCSWGVAKSRTTPLLLQQDYDARSSMSTTSIAAKERACLNSEYRKSNSIRAHIWAVCLKPCSLIRGIRTTMERRKRTGLPPRRVNLALLSIICDWPFSRLARDPNMHARFFSIMSPLRSTHTVPMSMARQGSPPSNARRPGSVAVAPRQGDADGASGLRHFAVGGSKSVQAVGQPLRSRLPTHHRSTAASLAYVSPHREGQGSLAAIQRSDGRHCTPLRLRRSGLFHPGVQACGRAGGAG
jgi:hypothetical protein